MNYSDIHAQIERLNLEWQEYDFGDTLYAEIPIVVFSAETGIVANCMTQKYTIQFQDNGYVLAFKEKEEVSFITKMIRRIRKVNHYLAKEENSSYKPEKQFIDR